MAFSYFNSFKLPIKIIRPFNIYGPRQSSRAVIPSIIIQALNNKREIKLGNIKPTRDFTYVKDVVKGMLLILENGKSMKPYNLGSGEKLTIGQVVNTIVDFCEVSPEVVWDSSKPTTIPFKLSDIDRITKLGFKTDYTFKQGIKETMEWYLNEL